MGYFINLVGCGASVHTVDDISQTTVKNINLLLKALCKASLQLNINKCKFYKIEVLYLKLVISINSI